MPGSRYGVEDVILAVDDIRGKRVNLPSRLSFIGIVRNHPSFLIYTGFHVNALPVLEAHPRLNLTVVPEHSQGIVVYGMILLTQQIEWRLGGI